MNSDEAHQQNLERRRIEESTLDDGMLEFSGYVESLDYDHLDQVAYQSELIDIGRMKWKGQRSNWQQIIKVGSGIALGPTFFFVYAPPDTP